MIVNVNIELQDNTKYEDASELERLLIEMGYKMFYETKTKEIIVDEDIQYKINVTLE